MWSQTDLYGFVGTNAPPTTSEQTSAAGPVQRGSTMSWLMLVILFFIFRMVYEWAGEVA